MTTEETELSGLTSSRQSNRDDHPSSNHKMQKSQMKKSASFKGSILRYQYIPDDDQALDEMTESEYRSVPNLHLNNPKSSNSIYNRPIVSPLHHVASSGSIANMSHPSTPFPGAVLRYHTSNQLSTIPTSTAIRSDRYNTEPTEQSDAKPDTPHTPSIGWNKRLLNPNIWRAAVIELLASMIMCFMSSCNTKMSVTYFPQYPPLPIGVVNGLLIALIIFGTAQSSGGHFNWLITISTTFCGLCEIERCIIYLPIQLIGYCIGTGLYQIVIDKAGEKVSSMDLTGCTIGEATTWQALIVEIISTLFVCMMAFGTAFDPQQGQIYGQFMAPWFIGVVVAIITITTSSIYPVFTGAFTNPTRCLSPAIISADFDNIWPFVIGPIIGAALFAPLYIFIPPNHVEKYAHQKSKETSKAE